MDLAVASVNRIPAANDPTFAWQSAMNATVGNAMPGSPLASGSAQPSDWLLLLLALRDADQPLDPVRLQKGLFLLAEEGGLSTAEAYKFEPYDFGPFSAAIYDDLQTMVSSGWVKELAVPGYNWKRYAITKEGLVQAQDLVDRLDGDRREMLRRLATIKQELLELKFNALLRRVYDRHPGYAVNSVFRYAPNRVF